MTLEQQLEGLRLLGQHDVLADAMMNGPTEKIRDWAAKKLLDVQDKAAAAGILLPTMEGDPSFYPANCEPLCV